ncbi:Uncharacterised protein [Mycobacteroides abscessus subsp. bolletii]|nr:Uncharacterised protein [Mycobacteroides abscessus subsp. bolletii]SIH01583.1 Uncharacterised protein [Mycobacteroides abscessus subsp. bolletii]SKF00690.1 Uncharacterised protein [Mycobacteroides abscessus subsp. bolletii]SKK71629.1 Uncharacterised protein [Mycobacteroides abscessus subsp. bolletii]SKM94647.1 Uncharacterised protein [Mycobacteroides abscessus subsp. bolletii]
MCPSATSGVSLPVTKPRAESSFDGLPPGYSPCVNRTVIAVEPRLPQPRGPLSAVVIDLLAKGSPSAHPDDVEEMLAAANPYGLDLQLALCVCYELHYRGFSGVDPRWEWDIGLLNLRRRLEEDFLARLESDAGQDSHEYAIAAELDALMREPEDDANLSVHLAEYASWEHMQEYFAQRSIYHLKEGDPQAWVIPRLSGQAKASFVAIEFDEFGGGHENSLHQSLFGDLLAAAGMDPEYLGYLEHASAESLAAVNVMSLFGLHRALRGGAIGHFAATEITSPPGSRQMVRGLQRLSAPSPCVDFYQEHVEADAVHEEVVRSDVVANLVETEPGLSGRVVFGMRVFRMMEDRLAHHLLSSWALGRSSLNRPLS